MRATGIITFVAGANAVAVESGGAVGHSGGPFAYDNPVVDVGRVCAGVTAGILAVVLDWPSNLQEVGNGGSGVVEDAYGS